MHIIFIDAPFHLYFPSEKNVFTFFIILSKDNFISFNFALVVVQVVSDIF